MQVREWTKDGARTMNIGALDPGSEMDCCQEKQNRPRRHSTKNETPLRDYHSPTDTHQSLAY